MNFLLRIHLFKKFFYFTVNFNLSLVRNPEQ
jgi:hypothetical protein